MHEDLEFLSDLPNGKIILNLLTGEASHSIHGQLEIYIANEIQIWLQSQGEKDGIDISQLKSATLEVDIDTSRVATNKKKIVMFVFNCNSHLETDERHYKSNLREIHHWHYRTLR